VDWGNRGAHRNPPSILADPQRFQPLVPDASPQPGQISGSSVARSGGMMIEIGLPTASSIEYPNIRAAAGFQLVIMPSSVFPMIASSHEFSASARCADCHYTGTSPSRLKVVPVVCFAHGQLPRVEPLPHVVGTVVREFENLIAVRKAG